MRPDDIYYSDIRARNIFGIPVEDDSMAPDFRRGDIAVVNPNLAGRPGDYVAANIGGRAVLCRMGAGGAPETVNGNEIMGRVVERKRVYK